jgi:hypothetical protein
MTPENRGNDPSFIYALPLNLENAIESVLDTPVGKIKNGIHIGTLKNDNTIVVKGSVIKIDRALANPGEKVITHDAI